MAYGLFGGMQARPASTILCGSFSKNAAEYMQETNMPP